MIDWDKFKRKKEEKKVTVKPVDEPATTKLVSYEDISDVSEETERKALNALPRMKNHFHWGGCQPEGKNEMSCRFGLDTSDVLVKTDKGFKRTVWVVDPIIEVTDFNQARVEDASELEKEDDLLLVR